MATYNITNPPVLPSMDEIRAQTDRYGGLAKSARFMARIIPEGASNYMTNSATFMRDLSYLCEAAEFPGRGFQSQDLRYYGPNFKVPYQTSYEDLNLTFLCRDAFYERQLFDTWMEVINPNATYNFSYRDDYTCKIELFQISDIAGFGEDIATAPEATYKFSFIKAWPVLINPQPVTWADDNFHRLTVTFTFTKWMREEGDYKIENTFDIVNNREIIGSQDPGGVFTPRLKV